VADDEVVDPNDVPPFKSNEVPSVERRIHSIAHELAATAKRHGGDSVALQAGLLIHSLNAGAVGVTEVAVVGESPQAGNSFLEVDVTTGIILDSEGSTPGSELAHMWQHIAVPTLKTMHSFQTDPRGLEIVFLYGLQRFADRIDNKADPTAPSLQRMMRIAIPEGVLSDLAAGEIDLDAVLARSTVRDDKRVIPATELAIR
jgi:hypothetical protein